MAQLVLRTLTVPSLDRYVALAREIPTYWMERSRTRRQLRVLEDHVLEDIGITRERAMVESGKYFWQH